MTNKLRLSTQATDNDSIKTAHCPRKQQAQRNTYSNVSVHSHKLVSVNSRCCRTHDLVPLRASEQSQHRGEQQAENQQNTDPYRNAAFFRRTVTAADQCYAAVEEVNRYDEQHNYDEHDNHAGAQVDSIAAVVDLLVAACFHLGRLVNSQRGPCYIHLMQAKRGLWTQRCPSNR
jgi:hypothetical protein